MFWQGWQGKVLKGALKGANFGRDVGQGGGARDVEGNGIRVSNSNDLQGTWQGILAKRG